MQNPTFSDLVNGVAGMLFQGGGTDYLIQSIQLAIIMIGSNPFLG